MNIDLPENTFPGVAKNMLDALFLLCEQNEHCSVILQGSPQFHPV